MGFDFSTFMHSSLSCAGSEIVTSVVQRFLADTVAHIGIAGILTAFVLFRGWPVWLFWFGLGLIVTKELAFDLPNANWAALVVFDSVWDVLSWFLGFFVHWWMLMGRDPARGAPQ